MNLKKHIGIKIKEHRLSRGMNQESLADLLKTTKQTVSRYENGDRQANQDVLFQLSTIFNVSIDDFFPREDNKKTVSMNEYNYYPTAISAGLPIEVDGITETKQINLPDSIMGKWSGDSNIFISKINGESMNKLIPDNSLIAVKPITLHSLKNGDIVVYSDNHEYSVKQYYKQDDEILFRPNSTDYSFRDDVYKMDNVEGLQIHGKVVLYTVELN